MIPTNGPKAPYAAARSTPLPTFFSTATGKIPPRTVAGTHQPPQRTCRRNTSHCIPVTDALKDWAILTQRGDYVIMALAGRATAREYT